MIIPVAIPLLHPLMSISVIISCSICNILIMIKMPTIKFGICIYYRIVSQVSFIFFNLLFAVCYVLDVYFPVVNICKADYLGYAFIVSMGIVIALEFV